MGATKEIEMSKKTKLVNVELTEIDILFLIEATQALASQTMKESDAEKDVAARLTLRNKVDALLDIRNILRKAA